MESRELSFVESAKNVIFNVRYKLISYFEEYRKNSLMLIGDSVFVLGQGFKVTEENKDQVIEAVYQLFLRTAWLTYRSGFPKIYN